MKVIAYSRVSTTDQADGTSLAEQSRQLEGIALTHGFEITHRIADAVSGALPFLDRLATNGVDLWPGDVVLVAKLDRFSRDIRDTLNSLYFCKENGIRLIINGHGDVTDEANIYSKLMFEILAVFAGHERRVIKDRQRTGQAAKKASGGHIGGSAPFGYDKVGSGKSAKLIPNKEQQAAIETIKVLSSRGDSLREISAAIEKHHEFKISHVAVKRILGRVPQP